MASNYTNIILAVPHAVGDPLDYDWRENEGHSRDCPCMVDVAFCKGDFVDWEDLRQEM